MFTYFPWKTSAQSCSATITSDTDFSAISWTAAGGADCSVLDGSGAPVVFNGDINLDYGNSNDDVNMDFDLTINGNFSNTATGNGNTMTIGSGIDIVVNGDMGDPNNNNLQYIVDGSLFVSGTLSGKNNNGFSGSGSISGGALDVKNGTTCPDPCPVSGGFDSCNSGDSFCTDANVLPVVLLFFNGSLEETAIRLAWATSMEEDFSHFDIEHADGDQHDFRVIGAIDGVGESTSVVHYEFNHLNPVLGLNHYRLKAVDIDGSFEYFGPKSIEYFGEQIFKLYPNPVSDGNINVELNFPVEKPLIFLLTDMVGRRVFSTTISASIQIVALPGNLSSGTYIASIGPFSGKLRQRITVL